MPQDNDLFLKKLKKNEIHSHEGRQQEQWKEIWSQKPGFFSGSEAPCLKEPSVHISSQLWFECHWQWWEYLHQRNWPILETGAYLLIKCQRAGLLAHWCGLGSGSAACYVSLSKSLSLSEFSIRS